MPNICSAVCALKATPRKDLSTNNWYYKKMLTKLEYLITGGKQDQKANLV